jgi:hypothetical protein
MTRASRSIGLQTLLLALPAAALAACYYQHKTGVDDLWWHLRTGQWMWEHRGLPRLDPFSYVTGGESWINFEWLYQLFVYAVFRAGQFPLVTLAHGLVAALALLLVARSDRDATPRAAAVAVWIAAAGQFVYPWSRPHVWTQLGVALYLFLLPRATRLTARRMALLLLLQVLWVNVHGGYVLGLFILAGFAIEQMVERRPSRRAWMLAGSAAAATLLNPYGPRLIAHGLNELRSNYASVYIREWVSPLALHHNPATFVVLAMIALLIVSFYFGGGPQRPLAWLVAIAFGLLALRSVRFVSLFALASVPFLADNFTAIAARLAPAARDRARRWTPALLVIASSFGIWLVATGRLYALTGSNLQAGMGVDPDQVPADAVDFIERHQLQGPFFHIYDDGSYLIWRLHPREQVLIDPRSALYGDERLRAVRAPLEDPRRFHDLDARHHFQAALLPHGAGAYRRIITMLLQDPDWRLVHGDAYACLLVRTDGPNATRAPAWPLRRNDVPAGYVLDAPGDWPARNAWRDFWAMAPAPGALRHYGWARLHGVTGSPLAQIMHTREFLRSAPAYHWRYAPMRQWYEEQFATLGAAATGAAAAVPGGRREAGAGPAADAPSAWPAAGP